jgi:hypothetical protein
VGAIASNHNWSDQLFYRPNYTPAQGRVKAWDGREKPQQSDSEKQLSDWYNDRV